ncbi:MAG: LysR substrate-binding domain-containing protein [Pseudorhodoferax sp.]
MWVTCRSGTLESYDFIVREKGSGTRAALERASSTSTASRRSVVMEMSSNEAIKQAVMAGMGVSLLSLHTVWLEMRRRAAEAARRRKERR